MTKSEYPLPSGDTITSVILQQEEFDNLYQHLKNTPEEIELFKKTKQIPVMVRSITTEVIFNMFNIKGKYCCFCMQEFAETVKNKLTNSAEIDQATEKIVTKLTPDTLSKIDSYINKILTTLETGEAPDNTILEFLNSYSIDRMTKYDYLDQIINSMALNLTMYKGQLPTKELVIEEFKRYLRRLLILTHDNIMKAIST